jgi:signal transduction histidine kinase
MFMPLTIPAGSDRFPLYYFSAFGACFYPLSFSLLLRSFIKPGYRLPIPLIAIISSLLCLVAMAFPEAGGTLVATAFIVHASASILLLYNSVFLSRRMYLVMQGAFIFHLAFSIASIFTGSSFWYTISAAVLFIIACTLFTIGYLNHISKLVRHFQKSKDLNRQLIHTINRLRQKTEQLQKVIQEKDLEILQMSKHASLAEITAGIAHELTQPLTGIKGIAQNMMDDINYEEFDNLHAVSELIRICALVDKSSTIIDHIRNFSRKNGIIMQYLDINKVVLDAIELVNLQFKKNNIEIVLILDEAAGRIYGDKISLEQLVINFLMNARDAITEKKKSADEDFTGRIAIYTGLAEAGITLAVEDNGIGIAADTIKKIWSPFFTTKRKGNSTGVGLSISNRILRDHRATVSVESTPGSGTRFSVVFPARKESHAVPAL